MTMSPAPDVDRVLDRMGRSAFTYRRFPRPAAAAEPPPPPGATIEIVMTPAAAAPVFREPSAATLANELVLQPPNPFLPRADAPRPPDARGTTLSHMFSVLSARADRSIRRDGLPSFPFGRG